MPRGLPDYYNPDTIVSQRLANVEEVITAVQRMASVDNRGRTIVFEHFNENLAGWIPVVGGDGAGGVISTTTAYIPPSSLYIDAGTSGGSGESYVMKSILLGETKRIGLETAIMYRSFAPLYQVILQYNRAGTNYEGRLTVNPADGVINIGVPGDWTAVGEIGFTPDSAYVWLPLKLVCDFEDNIYMRALIGQTQIDLTDSPLKASSVARPGAARFFLFTEANQAVNNDAYFGYAAITVDEP